MELIKWRERSFDFTFPTGVFPAIVERLRGTPIRLEKMLEGIDRDTLTRKTGTGWSAQEHAGHLLNMEELHERRFEEYSSGATILSPADMANKKTENAQHNLHDIKDIISAFQRARRVLIAKAENANDELISKTAVHPRLNKEMRLVDMLYFTAEHDDHHLAIIRKLLKKS